MYINVRAGLSPRPRGNWHSKGAIAAQQSRNSQATNQLRCWGSIVCVRNKAGTAKQAIN